MFHHNRIVIGLPALMFLLCAQLASQAAPVFLKNGNTMPSIVGQTLLGKWVDHRNRAEPDSE